MGLLIQVEQPQHEPFFFRFVMGKALKKVEDLEIQEIPAAFFRQLDAITVRGMRQRYDTLWGYES
jgi:hypothetical protein